MVVNLDEELDDILAERKNEVSRLRSKFRNRIPVICIPSHNNPFKIERSKFLVPVNMMYGEFKYLLQKHLNCQLMDDPHYYGKNSTVYLYVNNKIPKMSTLLGDLFRKHKSEDGILYMVYSSENTLG
ncbi:autophagy protein 8I, putative [Theileria annulata]|uniref:Autophagy-related protein n=1 Tax=Theileria annulata TaxID=5874 RepID=Q4UE40_THEAN|nr:autophagy protein 8I, putative [Theileria annulata]CAI74649.1 autophagy protein 8I, putative [Theileria annulata]|eukprot:XP_952381.1 autophagy protein 8I, putative [Theileria annulata]